MVDVVPQLELWFPEYTNDTKRCGSINGYQKRDFPIDQKTSIYFETYLLGRSPKEAAKKTEKKEHNKIHR